MINYLELASKKYYEGNPIISDAEFDYLAKLYNFNQLGNAPKSGGINHLNRLYSLQKFYEDDTLPNISKTIKTPKLDGAAISLLYVDGYFACAATRGNGLIGEDITHNFTDWEGIPDQVSEFKHITQIIGEIVAPRTIENSRNYATGASRLKNPEEFRQRTVEFIAYGVFKGGDGGYLTDLYEKDLQILEEWGFKTVLQKNLETIYPTDGIVFRCNSNEAYKKYGFTNQYPKGAYALKDTKDFEAKETKLLDVIWQTGKTGKVTPVAIFEEIQLEDAKINRATLHNAGFIESLNLYIGDSIIITRAGGIIPKVLGVA